MPSGSRRQPPPAAGLVLALALWLLGGAMGGAAAASAGASPTIDQLEAALILTITRFVEWPSSAFASPASPLVIGVVADEGIALAVEATAKGRQVNRRSVVVTRLQWDSRLTDAHLLFVGSVESRRLNALLDQVRGRPVLTVSAEAEFARAGGMLAFHHANGRVSFSANTRSVEGSGLQLTSFLLAHATAVSEDARVRSR